MHDPHPTYDIVIAGAGPVGLFFACELGLRGVSVLVLERATDPRSALKRAPFGVRGLTIPSVEALDRHGVLDALTDGSAAGAQPRRHSGHFAGMPFDEAMIDTTRWRFGLPAIADRDRMIELERLETVLATRAESLGVTIRRGVAVDGFEATDATVTIRAGGESITAGWLVGCDGGRSIVRKAGGFRFLGTEPTCTGYSVQCELTDATTLPRGRHATTTGFYFQSQPGHFGLLDFDGGAFHRTAPITLDRVQSVLRRVSQTDVTLHSLQLATSWTDRAMQAVTYRNGRVLLAGDAAHVHAPLGGQGLNLGLGDAANLGWKLAAAVRGTAPDGLLDSYTAERHPVGAAVLDWSRAQMALLQPTPQARALAAIMRDLIATRDGTTYFAERVWAASLRYDLGDAHPLVGCAAPDFALVDGTRFAVALREGRGVLIDFDGRAPLRALASRYDDRIRYLATDVGERLGLDAVLVRPDGVVAWAGTDDLRGAEQAAARWFGATASERAA